MSVRDIIQAAAGVGGAADTDPNFKQTVLLLHGDGTNGAQNNTFLDSSTNNFTITRNGNTTQGTFSPFSAEEGKWSAYFDGSSDWLSVTDNSLNATSTDYTIEFWMNTVKTGSAQMIYELGTGALNDLQIYVSTTALVFQVDGNTPSATASFDDNTWVYVACVKSGSTLYTYVNGTRITADTSVTVSSKTTAYIGMRAGSSLPFRGYLANLRISNTARYTQTTMSVPENPFTSDGNTVLLTLQSNRFVDRSGTPKTITRNGDVRVTPFSPFAPTAAYSAGTNGGSGYFDGTSDWLNVGPLGDAAFNFGTGAFTIEGWIYPAAALSATTYSSICAVHDGVTTTSWGVYARSNGVFMYGGGNIFVGGGTINPNTFTHFAVTRSGNTVTVYVNGEQVAQNTGITGAYDNSGDQLKIGDDDGSSATWNGYIASLRIIKGQALTTGAFTPPTVPVTTSAVGWTGANVAASITGTVSLLCNFTNAGIIDNTGKNNLETVGNAQIDTAVKKYGTGSLEFDRVDDRLVGASPDVLTFGTGDFTVEAWVNFRSFTSGYPQLIATNTGTNGQPQFAFTSTTAYVYGPSLTTYSRSFTWALNTWYHVAFVRASGSLTIYVNGSALGTSQSMTENLVSPNFSVGAYNSGAANGMFDGFIDDLRVTRGVARYTANFTAPTKTFADQ